MANIHRACNATNRSEHRFAQLLSGFDDRKLHLYFSLDFIPGGREIDLLLVHEDVGVFIIEVKGFGIDNIESLSPDRWQLKDRGTTESPALQAFKQYDGLKNALAPYGAHIPFVVPTVALPAISRADWLERFSGHHFARRLADSFLFEEDISCGTAVLLERLALIHANPPVRSGREPRPVQGAFLELLKNFVEPALPLRPTVTERQRLKAIEEGVTAQLQRDYEELAGHRVAFIGWPGTGKTFRLLSLGAMYAYRGKRVLFACFNKTLAADVRRLLSFSERLRLADNIIDVLDVNQLAVRCFDVNGFGFIHTPDPDEWGQMVVNELMETPDRVVEKYDAILIDESQDMHRWQLDLLGCHLMDTSSVFVAVGQGQELYGDDSFIGDWLRSLQKPVQEQRLRRNFRNPQAEYGFAHAVYEAWPDKFESLPNVLGRLLKQKDKELTFDRPRGAPPKYVQLAPHPDEFVDQGRFQVETVANSFYDVIRDTYQRMSESDASSAVGMLILVPASDSLHARAARVALTRLVLETNIGVLDYTVESNRRTSPSQDQIRLATFHSARGLEADYVVAFGLEEVQQLAEHIEAKPENLAFVALTRSLFATTIATRTARKTAVNTLLERAYRAMESVKPKPLASPAPGPRG